MKSSVPYVLPEARDRVITMVARGRYIPAIKFVRQVTGAELKEAKEYVDGLKGEAFARMVPPDVQAKARALVAEGKPRDAVKLVRKDSSLHLKAAKDYVDAIREGRLPATPPPGPPMPPGGPSAMGGPPMPQAGPSAALSDRVRAFKHAEDYESAIALVCAETGMGRDEAQRFVDALR